MTRPDQIDPTLHDTLRRLEPTAGFFELLRSGGAEIIPIGPFRAILDPHTGDIEAVPVEPLGTPEDTLRHVQTLSDLAARHGSNPSIEFNELLWTDLGRILLAAGFTEYCREPLMFCTPAEFRPYAAPDVTVRFLRPHGSDADLASYQRIFVEVLVGEPWQGPRLARLRDEIERITGGGHALATLNGRAVGTGFISSSGGVSEITRVATIPEARRRGVATTVTTFMMRDSFERGDTLIWLSAADAAAQALYAELGFQTAGDRVVFRKGI